MSDIKESVGDNGARNNFEDVRIVQVMINKALSARAWVYLLLKEDGKNGPKTMSAIEYFQREFVHLARPDRRVDPRGLTIRVLRRMQPASTPGTGPSGSSDRKVRTIRYRKNAREVLSEYTKEILRFAMQLAEVQSIDISSTHRQVSDQARIMFNDNEAARRNGQTVQAYRGYGYGTAGKAVDNVYADNVGKVTADQLKVMMAEEISAWLRKGVRTSKHCVEASEYARNNILDIPYSGVAAARRDEFEQTLVSLANSFNKRKYSKGMHDLEGYHKHKLIDKVIVERACWHIEIPQNPKKIPTL